MSDAVSNNHAKPPAPDMEWCETDGWWFSIESGCSRCGRKGTPPPRPLRAPKGKRGPLVRERVWDALAERGWLDGVEMMTDEIYALLPDIPEVSIRQGLRDLERMGRMVGCSALGKEHHRRFWKATA